ncbi:hypothetical protein [Catenuloplanes atrovinosus]|uniref:Uncharacterized protein n=1 Tax=Catenuloplanes atrovinosus TaxID=137266 RepID=A0AAE4CC30_9ACTN|nr:hypothetical protein [Catenuloplanes atrovinosus]MDR7276150.1 hypothetical protein [Catenuloplanes atrovinosus]
MVTRCPECGGGETRDAWDGVVDGRLTWTVTGRCPDCPGSVWEACGWDDTPPEIRDELLERRGVYRLAVAPRPGWSRMGLLRALRREGATVGEIQALADRVLAGEATGTEGEMQRLAHRIRTAGLDGTTERVR